MKEMKMTDLTPEIMKGLEGLKTTQEMNGKALQAVRTLEPFKSRNI